MRLRVLVDNAIAGTPAFVHECVELLACGFAEGLNECHRTGDGRPTDSGFSALIAGDTVCTICLEAVAHLPITIWFAPGRTR